MSTIEAPDPTRWQREWSPRKARICPNPTCQARHFGDLTWTCPEHGTAVDQEDRPYDGLFPKAVRPEMQNSSFSALPPKPPDGLTYGKR
jgi:hypothetical protein